MITQLALVLAATCLATGAWCVLVERRERRREGRDARLSEPRHVHVVRVPYDWEERT
jgi:hypothetical protein